MIDSDETVVSLSESAAQARIAELELELDALRSIVAGNKWPARGATLLGQEGILQMLASGSSAAEVLREICRVAEYQLPGAHCSIMRMDASGKSLRQAVSASLPQAYLDAMDGMPVGPECPPGGTACFRLEQVIVSDIASDPRCQSIRDRSLKFGLRACWSKPIVSTEGKALGCWTVYFKEPKAPTVSESGQHYSLIHLAALALEREQREQSLRETSEFTRSILGSSIDAIKVLNLDGEIEFINDLAKRSMEAGPDEHLAGRTWTDLFPEPDRSSAIAALEMARLGRESRLRAFRPTLRGNPKWWDILVVPVRGADQNPAKILVTSRDITEQRLAEDALRLSEGHLRNVLDSLFAFVGVCTPDGVLTFANKAPLEAAGLRSEDVIGKAVWDTFWFCYSDAVSQQLRAAFDSALEGKPSRYDVDVRMRGETLMPIDFMLAPLRDAQGKITHVIASAVEISGRKQAETDLKNNKERLELAQAATKVGIFDWDIMHDTSICSPEWLRIYGFPDDGPMPTHEQWVLAVHPEDREEARQRALQAVQTEESHSDEFRVIWPDGSVHWVSTSGKTLFKDGQPWRLIGTALDITLRKEAETSMHQSEERFRTVVEAVPGLVFLTDDNGRNIFTNKIFQQYTGLKSEELLGDKWSAIVHHADLQRNLDYWKQCVEQAKPYEIEHRFRRWDGVYRWMLTRGVPLRDEAEQVQRWLGICTDIEDQKRTEQVLRQTVENLEQYAYVASHDLQEPLRTIAAFTQILDRKYRGQLDETADKYIHFIVHAANRMQSLIEDLLAYSRANSDKERVIETVDLNELFDEVVNTLHARITETHASVSHDSLPTLSGDRGGLGQVLQNLLANALKYRQPAIAPVISFSIRERDTDWCFTMTDNGIGFQPEQSERIFGIFKRLHGSDVPGTGIGLAIVKTIVERHGGHIWASSAGTGTGASFSFTLPK